MEYIKVLDDDLILQVKVIPNSSKNEFLKTETGNIKLKITAPPVDNKANKFVVEFLSKKFKVPKTSIQIIRGETAREKTILFHSPGNDKSNFIKEFFSSL